MGIDDETPPGEVNWTSVAVWTLVSVLSLTSWAGIIMLIRFIIRNN